MMEGIDELLKSKTFWVGALLIAVSIYNAISGASITTNEVIQFLVGSGFITMRHAIAKL